MKIGLCLINEDGSVYRGVEFKTHWSDSPVKQIEILHGVSACDAAISMMISELQRELPQAVKDLLG